MHEPVWGFPRRLGFLAVALFFGLQSLGIAWVVPVVGVALGELEQGAWDLVVPWVGAAVFGLHEGARLHVTGSGDTLWAWVQAFTAAAVSLAVAVVVARVDRRRPNYAAAHAWLVAFLRHALAFAMFAYGLAKVYRGQFAFPSLMSLAQPIGESSPMGLAWTFMGYSRAYTVFAGLAELLAGALLLWRPTATLGAVVALGVMANVVAMNFSYDIPVKLLSSTLLAMAVVVMWRDLPALFGLFVRGRAVRLVAAGPVWTRPWQRRARVVVKAACGLAIAGMVVEAREVDRMFSGDASRTELYGMYEVERFVLNGVLHPPLTTDPKRWRRVYFESFGLLYVEKMAGEGEYYTAILDAPARTLAISRVGEERPRFVHRIERTDPERLVLRGNLSYGVLEVGLKKVDRERWLLVSRGFNWVQEYPFNR